MDVERRRRRSPRRSAGEGLRRPGCPRRHRRERARGRSPRHALQHPAPPRPRGRACIATASSCPRCTSGCSTASAPATTSTSTELPGIGRVGGLICWENRMPLGPLAGVRGRPADLGGAHRRRQRRLDRVDAPHRHRGRCVRRERPAVHPALCVPRRLPARHPARCARCSAAAAPASSRRTARSSPVRSTTARASSSPTATCARRSRAKRYFDVAGHYGRADVLDPSEE